MLIGLAQDAGKRRVERRRGNKHRNRRGHAIVEYSNAKNRRGHTKRGCTDVKQKQDETDGKQNKGYLDERWKYPNHLWELPPHHPEVTEFTGLRPLLWERHCPQATVEFAYPALDEHRNECCEYHKSETGVEESIDNNNVCWRGEVGRDIWRKARIPHHLRLVNQDILYDIHGVRFEATKEFDEESAQETGEQRRLDNQSAQCNFTRR